MNMDQVIAERRLLYYVKGSSHQKELVVCIGAPYFVEEGMEEDVGLAGDAVCSIKFDGLPVSIRNVHGADRIQALELAIKVVESTLEGLKEKYDFYFADGDPYFEDDGQSKK
jgi:hypothetical protein